MERLEWVESLDKEEILALCDELAKASVAYSAGAAGHYIPSENAFRLLEAMRADDDALRHVMLAHLPHPVIGPALIRFKRSAATPKEA